MHLFSSNLTFYYLPDLSQFSNSFKFQKASNMSKIGNETTKKKSGKSEETPRNIVVAARIR